MIRGGVRGGNRMKLGVCLWALLCTGLWWVGEDSDICVDRGVVRGLLWAGIGEGYGFC